MKLYLVRHGESCANRDRHVSTPDVPLSEQGIKDAKSAGRLLSEIKFDRVLVSPYLRARQTQKYAMPSVDGEIVDDIHECICGSLEGRPWEVIHKEYPDLADNTRIDNYSPYGGECYEDIRKRVRSFMDYVISLDVEQIAAFSHAGFIQTFFDEVMGREGKPGRNILCKNGSISVFEYRNGKWYVDAWNVTENF